MSDRKQRLVLNDFSGGRNGADPPLGPHFQDTEVVDAVNVDWYRTTGARKRYGSSNLSMAGAGFVGTISWLGRFMPGISEADAEFWAVDDDSPTLFARLDNSATWTFPASTVDPPTYTSETWDVTCASLNGKFFISYKSGVNRLHCYDPVTNTVRRTGINPGTAAPVPTNSGVLGGYTDTTPRYYRVRWLTLGFTLMSEPTPASAAFTPNGTDTGVTVTRPTPPGENETHWYLEASTDNVTFYPILLSTIATAAVLDTVLTTSYASLTVSPLTGTFALQKSYRLIAADQNRLIGWGSWDAGDKQNRLELSAIVGSLDRMDAERVDATTNYFIDFDELDSGPPRALIGPIWDRFYAFKTRQMFELVPTGSIDQPYRRIKISGELGCVSSHGACRGEDVSGSPCLYILTHRGVYRYGLSGFEYLSRGIEDLLLGPTSVMNMAATKVVGHLAFYPDLNQLWVWFATGSSNDPDTLCVLDVAANGGRGAWTRYTGPIAHARCSLMFADTIGTSMGFALVPYIGSTDAANRIIKAADAARTIDADGAAYQGTLTTRPLSIPGYRIETGDVQVLAPAASVTLSLTVTPDFGASPTVTGTTVLTAAGAETRVTRPFCGSALAGAEFIQMTIGDASAIGWRWSFDRVIVPIQSQEPLT